VLAQAFKLAGLQQPRPPPRAPQAASPPLPPFSSATLPGSTVDFALQAGEHFWKAIACSGCMEVLAGLELAGLEVLAMPTQPAPPNFALPGHSFKCIDNVYSGNGDNGASLTMYVGVHAPADVHQSERSIVHAHTHAHLHGLGDPLDQWTCYDNSNYQSWTADPVEAPW
jgi:hypothetical protein